MKKLFFLFLTLFLLSTSCEEDEPNILRLQYDSGNVTGPFLNTGIWEAAVRFDEAETSKHIGKYLTKIEYYLGLAPSDLTLKVYKDDNNQPGELIYQASVGFNTREGRWSTHNMSVPYKIENNDPIWIAVRLDHSEGQQSIGCDAGPAIDGGDWLYSSTDNQWRTYRDRTGQTEDINWNIRGVIEE